MTNEEKLKALALDQASMIYGDIAAATHRERIERAAFVRRVTGEWAPRPGSVEAMEECRRKRAREKE